MALIIPEIMPQIFDEVDPGLILLTTTTVAEGTAATVLWDGEAVTWDGDTTVTFGEE